MEVGAKDASNHQDAASLQSIKYSRGHLQLLDQRRLPLEMVYLDVKDSKDGWIAIRDMVVRGAPAIAIAAALSLAVEVSRLQSFSRSSADAASYLIEKLDYLVSSRPTAVNLSDAATKLKSVVSVAAGTSENAEYVFKAVTTSRQVWVNDFDPAIPLAENSIAYTEAAEIMLIDDVADNKAIGLHGARCLYGQLKNDKKISVLTHCNTGSLATAGHGTALGVIRTLHAERVLERAFCTETRPFNQGSRLTAFELVHENIPATLIADSAAAALMKEGRVNAVIVGADRIAANGDTANKIGTFSLAISASFHGIPFYVAAPSTSIDLSISSGQQIVIEERTAKELTHARGGQGEQVTVSGISVWNPAFDVTPASLITGIITEKGVITKLKDGAFLVKDFLQSEPTSQVEPST